MKNEFKIKVRESLLSSAKDYFSLLTKLIILDSEQFEVQKRYVLKFGKTNFLHLTGLSTTLTPFEFFDKCLDSTISCDDFYLGKQRDKSTIRKKLANLVNLSEIFNGELLVQEDFIKNMINCKIATSDNKRTLGFADGRYCLYPKTLLDKNHLDLNKPIIKVKPIIIIEN